MPAIDITKDLSALFSKQALATPDLVALEDENSTWTYYQLYARVQDLADRLRNYGVKRDSLVGVLMGRSADYVVACLAALRAGGAFLVLELAYPPDLLAGVVADAKPDVIVTCVAQKEQIKGKTPLLVMDEPESSINGATTNSSPLPADDDLDRLAFVSYSSGTTGRPKGIANPHRAPVLSYDLRFQLSDVVPGDRVACNVFFVWEMLRPLLRGATVFAVPDDVSYDPVALVDLLSSRHITETLMTPTLLAATLTRHSRIGERIPQLKTLWLNGEVVTGDLARRAMKALPNTRLLNCYSASETHEIACGDISEMLDSSAEYCPVGPPMDPAHTYILDEHGMMVKGSDGGELWVGGNMLARGYLNLPEATEKAFKKNPFDPGQASRMYRTGDLARLLPSGLLEITGRVGAMLKIRGYSIVPGMVENTIVAQLAVRRCAVVAHGQGLDRQLVAYIVHDKEEPGHRTVLRIDEAGYCPPARQTLSAFLAQYMIPAIWVELDELPTHEVSGKVDLKQLPSPKASRFTNARTAGAQKSEGGAKLGLATIGEMWASSLKIPPSAVQGFAGTFFDLGGHSLTLADLATRLSRTFGFPVPLGGLAGNPTLQGHVKVVQSARDGHTAAVQADLPAVLRADSTLPDEIQPIRSEICPLSNAGTILLTGATGFLGAFLLSDLLESTSARIICLVRFNDPSAEDRPAGIARIRRNLLDFGLWNDFMMDRIEVLPGNLSRKRLGLMPDTFEELAGRVQVIIHAAATVNLVYPYAALRAANVGGTREVLRLACAGGATVQYISTNGVLPPTDNGWCEDAMVDLDAVPTDLVDGYGQTKWVAERLVLEARNRGLPARIYRLGTISAHSVTGATNAWDLITALIVEALQIGRAPDIDGWKAEMTPVDFVSKAVIMLANDFESSQGVFHLGDSSPIQTKDIFEKLKNIGYPTTPLPWSEWVAFWTEKRGSTTGGEGSFTVDILRGGMPSVGFLRHITILKDDATRPALAELQRPKVDQTLFETYARHWYARGWLSTPPLCGRGRTLSTIQRDRGPLSGRVAVVTGASSGIGATVAISLAAEGAHVALAARRMEELEVVRNKCMAASRGGKISIHQTDVTAREQVESLTKAVAKELGNIDILVPCAGVMYYTLMANARLEEWERTVDVNCKGLMYCLAAVVPGMLARGSGHVVAISSDAGRKVFPGLGVYSASKFFVEAALQSLRLETAGSGLRVTSIQPGNTATDLLGMSTDAEAVKKYGQPTGAKVLSSEEVAAAVVYALRQPPHVAINEVLIEPRDEPI